MQMWSVPQWNVKKKKEIIIRVLKPKLFQSMVEAGTKKEVLKCVTHFGESADD